MALSRRTLLRSSAALTVAATTASAAQAAFGDPQPAEAACSIFGQPPLEVIALNRMAYGPRPGDIERVKAMGFTAYVDEQLNPQAINDSDCDRRLSEARLHIAYDAGTGYAALNENRALTSLNKTTSELWGLARNVPPAPSQERMRPQSEVRVATWIRALYSKRQLFELLAEFWHNHFNIKSDNNEQIGATFPVYDRIIRQHALGNFRQFVEAIGRSTAMMYYLNNVTNKVAGGEGGNENYARELFELHTLGSDHYLRFYDQRDEIGVTEYNGELFARGYIDQDVYNASFCFTGWTIRNGHRDFPAGAAYNNGEFLFFENWHQGGPKLVLARKHPSIDFEAEFIEDRANPENEGLRVFDLVARHIGTARYICGKLCRRFIADEPDQATIDAAVAVWMANRDAPDQISKVVRTILLSDAFAATWGQKVKRPLELIWSYLRAVEAEFLPDGMTASGPNSEATHWGDIFSRSDAGGQRVFGWAAPTGHPDVASYWTNTNSMIQSWNLPYLLTQANGGSVLVDLVGKTNLNASCTDIVLFWVNRLFGYPIGGATFSELVNFMAQGNSPSAAPQPRKDAQGRPTVPDSNDAATYLRDRLNAMVQLMAMSPDFRWR
jgi:uncharacterized protein (DUF1800 family)